METETNHAKNLSVLIKNAMVKHPELSYSSQVIITELIDGHAKFDFIGFALAALLGPDETIKLANKIHSETEHHSYISNLLEIDNEEYARMTGIAQVMELSLEEILQKLDQGTTDFV